ncbi:hypothetical protein OAF28_01305 [Akkermansiaceae bacterium]|nr:hypothetical protein [Akkermansiaceae bacterium]
MLLIKRRLVPFLTSAILSTSPAYSAVLADFDDTQVVYDELATRTPGILAQQIIDNGLTGNFYRLLDGSEADAGNYLSFDSVTPTNGWTSASFKMDFRTDSVVADGFSIAFLDTQVHGNSGAVRAGSNGLDAVEERGLYSNSIGVGFRTFNGTNATVNYNGEQSIDGQYNLPAAGAWGSMEISMERDPNGTVALDAVIYSEPSQQGAASPFFTESYMIENVTLEDFRLQIAGRAGGSSMTLDLDNIELDVSFRDVDEDGLQDPWEERYGLSISDNGSVNPNNGPQGDPDADGLSNLTEQSLGTDPQNEDTDNDGLSDQIEVNITLTSPLENSTASSFGYDDLLSNFDGDGINYTTASINNAGRPGEINDKGPDGNYYRLLFGNRGDTSNYLAFDVTETSGWSTATLSFDVNADDIQADGFSVNFLDVRNHGETGIIQHDREWTPSIPNSIGVGFNTFNGTKATVWNGKTESEVSPYTLPADVWGNMSITVERDDSGRGTLTALGSFDGKTETIFDNYDLGLVSFDEFRVQIMGRTGGSAMYLDLDNFRLKIDNGEATEFPDLEDSYISQPNQRQVIDGTVNADNGDTLVYQWIFNEELIAEEMGGQNPKLTLNGVASEEGVWRLLISNKQKVVERTFTYSIAGPPVLSLESFYESPPNERLVIDVDTLSNNQSGTTYQWYFNGFPIPENFGGNLSSFTLEGIPGSNGLWKVVATNTLGEETASFQYRVIQDTDSDGLSDGYEEFVSQTDINNPDTDNDGLGDADEVNTYSTNPNSPDSDSDGFTDLYELETAYDPNSAESVPDALVEIMTAIEVKFNAALGATYAIEFSTDNQAWDVIEDDIVGEGGAIERLYSKQEYPTGFFRVERKDQ